MFLEFDAQYLQPRDKTVRSHKPVVRGGKPGASVPPVARRQLRGRSMARYEVRPPRVAFAIAAAAMAAITLTLSVVVPAAIEGASHEPRIVHAAHAAGTS